VLKSAGQIGEALEAEQQLAHDRQRPTLAYEGERVSRRAPVVVCVPGRRT